MQRAEMEELRQRDANLTALQAIGPRKKPKLESDQTAASAVSQLANFIVLRPSRAAYMAVHLNDFL